MACYIHSTIEETLLLYCMQYTAMMHMAAQVILLKVGVVACSMRDSGIQVRHPPSQNPGYATEPYTVKAIGESS